VPKLVKKADRAADALKRLGVNEIDLVGAPQITPLFKNAEGGLKAVLTAMRFYNDEEISRFLAKYDSLPAGDRDRLPWEAIAISAEVNPRYLTGSILTAMQAHSVSAVKVIALSGHAVVTKKMVEYAQLPSGEKDRSMLLQGLGFLPSPKAGPTFIGKAVFGPGARDDDDDKGGVGSSSPPIDATPIFGIDSNLNELFPDSEIIQEKLIPLRQRLTDGKK
jgi:hypothetical protein